METQPSIRLENQQLPLQRQQQTIMLLPSMQQRLLLLQAPIMELAALIEEELCHNPLLEKEEEPDQHEAINPHNLPAYKCTQRLFQTRNEIENQIANPPSLFSHLMQQARQSFTQQEIALAEMLIGHLDDRGFITTPLSEIDSETEKLEKLLQTIQTFEPYGIGARTIQESLLIQLRCQGRQSTLAYRIIENHYQELLHNRIPEIQRALKSPVTTILEAIRDHIAPLDLRPGNQFTHHLIPYIIPDAHIIRSDEKLAVEINKERLPSLRLHTHYMQLYSDGIFPKESEKWIRNRIQTARQFISHLQQRSETLTSIIETVLMRQQLFFADSSGDLIPLTMQEVANELHLHESTIARAVANKYIHSERGLHPLRSFFSHNYSQQGTQSITGQTIMTLLKQLIDGEDNRRPYSDEQLVSILKERGILCARRTIAKYRHQLNLGNAHQRKQFS
jgi:RNA polymerase sigma-54 factor